MTEAVDRIKEVLTDLGLSEGEMPNEADLQDLIEDIVSAEVRAGSPGATMAATQSSVDGGGGGVDTLARACEGSPVTVGARDGILVIQFCADGEIRPLVVRYGVMSEAKLEQHLMHVYHEIMRTRAIVGQRELIERRRANVG
jgi:hypothetical protein